MDPESQTTASRDAEKPAMIEKLTLVTIVVKNQEAALDFYTKTLGLEKRTDLTPPGAPRWVTVAPKGQDIEISLWEAGSRTEGVPPSHGHAGNGTSWNFQVGDCRKVYAELKARGVKFRSEPVEYPWAIAAAFADPDGNPLGITQPRTMSPSAWKND
jgi:catechol 2,3-dioxygenase-like lactoylglutathione lyase family enzyme